MARLSDQVSVDRPVVRLDVRPGWRVLWEALLAFLADNAMGMAGMIAFFAFLSLIPLLILLLTFLGDVAAGHVSTHAIRNLFHSVMPGLSQHDFLQTYWDPVRHSKVATRVLGVVSLLLGSMGLHDAVDWAVNRIWRAPRHRSFWLAKLRGLAVIIWVIAFSIFSLVLGWLWAVVLGAVHVPALVATSWLALIPALVVDVGIFAALYKLTPTSVVRLGPAVVAGTIGAGLWELSKVVFGWWVLDYGGYNRVYGPLAASVIVMLWLWVSAMIFLYGAEIARVLSTPPEEGTS